MLNRGAIILRYREPAIRWINETDPAGEQHTISAGDLRQDCTVYLISEEDADGDSAVNKWVARNFRTLFETELEGWITEPSLWPKKRTLKLFYQWFDVEYHSVIVDTVGNELYDDEA